MRPSRVETGGAGRREMAVVLGVAVLAAAVLVLAAGRTWSVVVWAPPGLPRTDQALVGRVLAPGAFAFGLAGLAGAVGVLATRGWARRVVGAVVALCGLGAVMSSALATGAAAATRELPAASARSADIAVQVTAWPWIALAAGAVLTLAGAVTVVRCARWPGMGARYDAPKQREAEPDMWRALDRGDDPTV
ncbi:MAG: MFS transporter [Streptosporangiales bacterium]|nr:MFS transporter [Streptosporangiales bacterium]